MKIKIIDSLKSRVLLVDGLPEITGKIIMPQIHCDNDLVEIMGKEHPNNYPKYLGTIPDGNWNLLCKLKDLTDNDCEGLVESCEISCKDYVGGMYIFTLKESFLSALEAENVLFENPFEKPNPSDFDNYHLISGGNVLSGLDWINYENALNEFYEAEQNVFSENTLVFVEQ